MLSFVIKRPVFKQVGKIALKTPVQMMQDIKIKAAVTPGYRYKLLPTDVSAFCRSILILSPRCRADVIWEKTHHILGE